MGASIIAALLLEVLDRALGHTRGGEQLLLAFSGGPEAARAVLETIAGSILTLTALVFSITMLVLQLTSTQYSPRALRTFLLDRSSKVAMGVFLGTFSFAIVGLRAVRSGTDSADPFVPGMLVTGAFVLTLASLYMFLFYIHHIAQRIQASSIIASIADETRGVIDRHFSEAWSPAESPVDEPGDGHVLGAPHGNTVTAVDEEGLISLAQHADVRIHLLAPAGSFVVEGQPLLRIVGGTIDDSERALKHVQLGHQRTMEQDAGFGFRQLVDIAVRALSPSVNDPSTAVQAVDRIHDLLCRLGGRSFPDTVLRDEDGQVRLVTARHDWEHFVRLAVTELSYYGSEHPQVAARLDRMKEHLSSSLPAERASVVRAVFHELAGSSHG